MNRPWDDNSDSIDNAKRRVRVAFEFLEKLGAPFYAFHDRDVAPEGTTLAKTNKNLDAVAVTLKQEQKRTGIRLLWGTSALFANPAIRTRRCDRVAMPTCSPTLRRRSRRASKSPRNWVETGFTFWGGREGYSTLLNTDMKRELDHLAAFLHMAVDFKKEIGFKGQFYIEPKPKEPTKHQYDSDAAACLNFLRQYDLLGHLEAEPGDESRDAGRTQHAARNGSGGGGGRAGVD